MRTSYKFARSSLGVSSQDFSTDHQAPVVSVAVKSLMKTTLAMIS